MGGGQLDIRPPNLKIEGGMCSPHPPPPRIDAPGKLTCIHDSNQAVLFSSVLHRTC